MEAKEKELSSLLSSPVYMARGPHLDSSHLIGSQQDGNDSSVLVQLVNVAAQYCLHGPQDLRTVWMSQLRREVPRECSESSQVLCVYLVSTGARLCKVIHTLKREYTG